MCCSFCKQRFLTNIPLKWKELIAPVITTPNVLPYTDWSPLSAVITIILDRLSRISMSIHRFSEHCYHDFHHSVCANILLVCIYLFFLSLLAMWPWASSLSSSCLGKHSRLGSVGNRKTLEILVLEQQEVKGMFKLTLEETGNLLIFRVSNDMFLVLYSFGGYLLPI